MRSAEAFGAAGVVCLPGTVNAGIQGGASFGGKCVSVAGAECRRGRDAGATARGRGADLATTTQGAQPAKLVNLAEPVALMIGNEGNGVPVDLAAKADGAITIPCPGPVESLNAAVAASVLLYEAARQRAAKNGGPRSRRGGTR